jgi:hypothetical protein
LLHDSEKLPFKTVHPFTARAERNHRVALGMLRLQVQGNDGSWCFANIFADEGSDTTLVRSAFATALKIRGSPQVLTVDGAGGVVTSRVDPLPGTRRIRRDRHTRRVYHAEGCQPSSDDRLEQR